MLSRRHPSGSTEAIPASHPRWVRVLAFLLPVLCVMGPYASILPGRSGFPYFYRIAFGVLLVVVVPLALRRSLWREKVPAAVTGLTCWWGLWMVLALIWSPNRHVGIVEVLASGLAALGAGVAFLLVRGSEHNLARLRGGWLLAWAVMMVIGLVEIVTGYHTTQVVGRQDWLFRMRTISATFANPNGLGIFCAFGFLLLGTTVLRGTLSRRCEVLAVIGLVVTCYVCLAAGGRAGQYSIVAVGVLLTLVGALHRWRSWVTWTLLVLALLTPVLGTYTNIGALRPPLAEAAFRNNPDTYKNPENRLDDPGASFDAEQGEILAANRRADGARVRYMKMGCGYVKTAPVVGHGAGATATLLKHDPHRNGLPIIPLHNSLLQITVNYGLVASLPIAGVNLYLVWVLVRGIRRATWPDVLERVEGLATLGIVAVASIGLSSIFNEPVFVAMLAFAAACAWVVSRRRRAAVAA